MGRPLRRAVSFAFGAVSIGSATASALGSTYLLVLTAASARHRVRRTSQPARFAIVVPAHNEEMGIGATVDSLAALDYPPDARRIVVVADNCHDQTAAVARAHGAEVLERSNERDRGKGYALQFAFDHLLAEDRVEAIVVIDADTVVDRNLLWVCAGELAAGAHVIQVDYQVRNPEAGWRTRLLDVAFTCSHLVRSSGRRRLGLSAGLRGNGMVFTTSVLRRVPYTAFSAVEDLEYGLQLGLAGERVVFASDTYVRGDMPSAGAGVATQRVRWEAGRAETRRRYLRPLTRAALERRDPVLADLAADLVVPPLGTLLSGLAVAAVASVPAGPATRRLGRTVAAAGGVALGIHVGTGVLRSQSGLRALPAMAKVPFYAAWKIAVGIMARARRTTTEVEWVRTIRSYEAPVVLEAGWNSEAAACEQEVVR
jgi:hypothetical protein